MTPDTAVHVGRVVEVDHPLVKHKLTLLRRVECETAQFRALVSEIANLLTYEATKDLETERIEIETPLTKMQGWSVSGKKVAVVPILVIWFGIGEVPAILTAFLISFFPIVVNVATGLATMEPELEDVLRALGAKKLDIMLKVGIPRTQPYLFGSLKVAITLAFVGAVVSETIASNAGLGFLMVQAGSNFQMPLVFAGLIGLARQGHFKPNAKVLFMHTGGLPSLHVYEDVVLGRVTLPD